MNVAGFYDESISNGIGWRAVLFVSGCPHKCEGCQNPQTWNKDYGKSFIPNDYLEKIRKNTMLKGLTLSGGEPLLYYKELYDFVKEVKTYGLDIWCYTGYKWEDLLSSNNQERKEFLKLIDVLIDGKFEKELRCYNKPFRGSSNQRIISVQESLKQNKVVLYMN